MDFTHVLAHVEKSRLQRAVDGLVTGSYSVTLTAQTDQEVRGFVTNGDGKQYGVVLSEHQSFCSCPDAIYRKGICKHAILLALFVIRAPKVTVETPEEQPVNLKLGKVRPGWQACA